MTSILLPEVSAGVGKADWERCAEGEGEEPAGARNSAREPPWLGSSGARTVTEVAAAPALNPSKRSGLLEPTGGGAGAEAKETGNSRNQCEEETRQGGCCSGQDSSAGLSEVRPERWDRGEEGLHVSDSGAWWPWGHGQRLF